MHESLRFHINLSYAILLHVSCHMFFMSLVCETSEHELLYTNCLFHKARKHSSCQQSKTVSQL
jgi:hypothetical protein